MLIGNAEVEGLICAVRIRDGMISDIASNLAPQPEERFIDGKGCALLPGLHDHHIHLNASAAALHSVHCGPPQVDNAEQLIGALQNAPGTRWIRGIGYHHAVAGEIDRNWLDENGPDRPIRIQHRGGRMWVLNSEAIDFLEMDIPENGCLVDGDIELRQKLGLQRPDLGSLIAMLHSHGITGVTEVTPGNDRHDFAHYSNKALLLNMNIMGSEDLHGIENTGRANVGPLKIHNHDYNLPPLAELTGQIADAHGHDRAVAIHCVTRAEMMLSLAAIEEAGVHVGDRIEHAAIADVDIIRQIAKLNLTVVTQPHFITERQEAYRRDVEPYEKPNLWRLKSFSEAGVKLAAGSDAPFGKLNPWKAMASAVERPNGFDQDEAISPETALALYTKPKDNAGAMPRKIAVGEPADLCLLDRSWGTAKSGFASVTVKATWVAGELVYDTISSTNPHSSAV